jgi:uncharacterized membrane-anchored protein
MKTKLIIGLFLSMSLIQIVTPLSMIIKRESVLKNGEQFKFKTVPVDPYDAFRGRYVALRIEEGYVPATKEARLNSGQTVYALINVDNQGFAKFITVTTVRPREKSYIQTKVRHISGDKVYLDLPIDRYYMEEKAAPAAERIYLQHTQRGKQDAYVSVRIKDGFAVIESLYVSGQKIEDAVRQEIKR